MADTMHRSMLALCGLAMGVCCLGVRPMQAAEKAQGQVRAAAADEVTFSVFLPLQRRSELEQLLAAQQNPSSASYRRWLTPAEFAARFAPDRATMEGVAAELTKAGLAVSVHGSRELRVSGPAAVVERLLGTALNRGTYRNGKTVYVLTATPLLPAAMRSAGARVVGLSGMIRATAVLQRSSAQPENRQSPVGGYFFDDLKQAYAFPSYQALTGKGVHLGVLMAGGFSQTDMDLYFGHEKLRSPVFSEVTVNGGSVYDPNDAGTAEAELDLQQSGGMAPDAAVTLYSIPDLSDVSIVSGLAQVVEDNRVDVLNMSFGAPEAYYTAMWNYGMDDTYLLELEHEYYLQGNAQGMTFIASSGDYGALPAAPPVCFEEVFQGDCGRFLQSVSAPASDPNVTAVGGTDLITTFRPGDRDARYVAETEFADTLGPVQVMEHDYATGGVWGSGGGSSVVFAQPSYQALVKTGDSAARTVPDVALHMGGCPAGIATKCQADDSYDLEAVGGAFYGVIGTSAAAPDFAGLAALTVEKLGTRLGNLNPYLYTLAAAQQSGALPYPVFHQGIPGNNGVFSTTTTGYNRVVGNGSVDGVNFLLMPQMPVAGVPGTASNP